MKKLIYTIALLSCISCVSMLEEDRSAISPDQYYKTEQDLNGACLTIYPLLPSMTYIRLLNSMGCISVVTDNRFVNLSRDIIPDSEEYIHKSWETMYNVIAKANFAVVHIIRSPVKEEIKNKYIAEAKILRSFAYLRLVKLWGDIPYFENFDISTDDNPVTPMAKVYENIMKDLTWAIDHVHPEGWDRARVDQIVGKTILADAYITCATSAKMYNPSTAARALKPYHDAFGDKVEEYYQKVKNLTTEIMKSKAYSLIRSNDWTDLWGLAPATESTAAYDHRNNEEFIWCAQTIPGLYSCGHFFVPPTSEYSPAHTGGIFQHESWQHVASMDRNDVRFKEHMWEYKGTKKLANGKLPYKIWARDINNPGTILKPKGNVVIDGVQYVRQPEYCLYPIKFYDKTYTDKAMGNEACVIPYYRMAEVYLWFAEAENELNGMSQEAVDAINPIRTRVNLEAYTAGQFTREEFRDRIINEYLWEFALEGKDFHVIQRYGQMEERCKGVETTKDGKPYLGMDPVNPRPRSAESYWLPYPLKEKQLNKEITAYRMNFE